MKDLFDTPELGNAAVASITAIISAITAAIIRRIEKHNLRRGGKLSD